MVKSFETISVIFTFSLFFSIKIFFKNSFFEGIFLKISSRVNKHKKGFIYYWEKNGVEYIHCDTNYQIHHVGGDCEHGIQEVEAGTREVRHEVEYNPWEKELKRVID